MSCQGPNALNPVCRLHDIANQAATDAFSHIAGWFGQAAADATTWLWEQIGSATTINLDSPHLGADLAVTGAIAAILCLTLFLIQVITGVLRREPGALVRAARGLVIALVASAFALAVTKVLLDAVDSLSDGVVQYTMNTNMEGLGRQLALATSISAATSNPAALLLFSIVILAAVVVVWAAMMIRKMMVIIAAVLTPLAFSGATADITRGWVRKWIEFMVAMIVSKLLLVIILMVGISVVEGAGETAHPGAGQALTHLATGTLILLMGGFAPWVAIKMFHFTGDALHTAHAYAAQAPSGARTVISAPQKINAMHSRASATVAKFDHNRGTAAPSGQRTTRPDSAQLLSDRAEPANSATSSGTEASAPNPAPSVGGGTTPVGASSAPSSVGAGAGSGSTGAAGGTATAGAGVGAAVAAPVVIPAVVAGATVSAAHSTGKAAGQAAQQATPAAATSENSATAAPTPAGSTPAAPAPAGSTPAAPAPAGSTPAAPAPAGSTPPPPMPARSTPAAPVAHEPPERPPAKPT